MLVTRKAIPRRAFLRGTGAALALPLLDAMTPAHERWIDDLMAGLTRVEMAHLLDLLGELKQSLTAAGAQK